MSSINYPALTESTYYILLSLTKPLHGYGIIQYVSFISNGRVILAAGTLYGAINSLLEKKWIEYYEANNDPRKKEYVITEEGRKVLESEVARLKELYNNGILVLGGGINDQKG